MKLAIGFGVVLLVVVSSSADAQPRVTRVSPAGVVVQAGGESVSVTIDGMNLDAVASARVMLTAFQTARGIAAALNRPDTGGRPAPNLVMVELTADRTAAPGSYYVELLTAARGIVRVPLTVRVEMAPPPVPPEPTEPIIRQPPQIIGGIEVPGPTVTAAAPTTVSMQAGGAAATVVLTGTMLDALIGAHVERAGARVAAFRVELVGGTAERRELRLTAAAGAGPPWDVPLDLKIVPGVGPGRAMPGPPVSVPVNLRVIGGTAQLSDEVFGTAIDAVIANARTRFNSCGTPSEHGFTVELPGTGYAASGNVPRLEHAVGLADRIEFTRRHSINPTSVVHPGDFANLFATAHPSPIAHTISAVRMCLLSMNASNNWRFDRASETTAGAGEIMVAVRFSRAFFRARGMPAEPSGTFSGLNVGILWGSPVTDREMPDFEHSEPRYEVRLPFTVRNGRITYGTVRVTLAGSEARWGVGEGPRTFLGPSTVQERLEAHAQARMDQIAEEIRKAFASDVTRDRISTIITSMVTRMYGATEVVSVARRGGTWEVVYR